VGLAAARRLARGPGRDGTVALLAVLAEELAQGRRDLRGLAHRWVACLAADPAGIDPETGLALTHLGRHDSPPSRAAGDGSDPLVRAVPVALAAFHSPRVLVSATYHIAALTHPEPVVAWSAVAVNVALSRMLQGKRDFIPDVIEALRGNDVPEELLARVRRVPIPERAVAGTVGLVAGRAADDAEAALRLAYHEPLLERGLRATAEAGPAAAGRSGLAGALLGSRDGADAVPLDWIPAGDRGILGELAARVVRATALPPGHRPAESPAGSLPSS
jgi:ADP-ribosylglycohydrolase